MEVSPSFISLIDESNRPLLVYANSQKSQDVNKVLKYNVFSNISLDYFESQLFQWSSLESHPEIKLFFQVEGVTVYGCLVKPTGLKIIAGFEEENNTGGLTDDQVEQIFIKVKKAYLRVKLNPLISTLQEDERREQLAEKLKGRFEKEFPN